MLPKAEHRMYIHTYIVRLLHFQINVCILIKGLTVFFKNNNFVVFHHSRPRIFQIIDFIQKCMSTEDDLMLLIMFNQMVGLDANYKCT